MTLDDYFMGRDTKYAADLTDQLRANAIITVARVNNLLAAVGGVIDISGLYVTSGWRPPSVNASTPGAARTSRHMTCEAVDLSDPFGTLGEFLFDNQQLLELFDLYLESPTATKGWTHLQTIAPGSGNRVFRP